MNKKIFILTGLMVLLALLTTHQTAFAHQGITVGDYALEIGWLTEPPIVGQQNAIVVNVSNPNGGEALSEEDVMEGLTVTISYNEQSKLLTLQPLGGTTPGQFIAPILPTVAGQYLLTLGGKLGTTDINSNMVPEEVQSADTLQFPAVEAVQPSGGVDWLAWLGIFLGLIGIGLGVTALRKAR